MMSFFPTTNSGATPTPDADDQGEYPLCSSYAIAKALVNGYKKGKFTNGAPVYIDQKSVAESLVNLYQDHLEPICPTEFDQESVKVFGVDKIIWNTKMYVTKVRRSQISKELLTKDNLMTKEYLITCQEGALSPYNAFPNDSDGLHCIYVDRLGPDNQSVICKNSWDDDRRYPHVKLSDIVDLFKVTFVASLAIPRTDEPDTGDDHTRNDPNETIVLDRRLSKYLRLWSGCQGEAPPKQ